jgi:G8 domain
MRSYSPSEIPLVIFKPTSQEAIAVTVHSKHSIRRALGLAACTLAVSLVGCDFSSKDKIDPQSPIPSVPLLSKLVGLVPMDYTIAAGETFYIDKSYTVGNLTIHGKLYCLSDLPAPVVITARSITVSGPGALLECGNEAARFRGKISFLLTDDGSTHAGHVHGAASATLSVSDGGTLRMFGDRVPNFGWQRIVGDVTAGSSAVRLETPVGWKIGDLGLS